MNCIFRSFLVLPLLAIGTAIMPAVGSADWSGDIEGGTVIRDAGNSTRLRLTLANQVRPFTQDIYVEWLRDSDGGNSYQAGYVPRYWFTDNLYGFGEGRYRVDKPLAIDRELLLLTGVGVRFLNTAEHSLFAELGAGIRDTTFDSDLETSEELVIARAGFFQELAEQLRFEVNANGVHGETIDEAQAEASVALRVPGGAVRYTYRTRLIKIGDQPSLTDSDSFVSFTYGF
ncbi:MAG: DUF481 domain-containing protein [Granulosicoccus sp.]